MKYIKLFLAMSEAELREERMELSDYIRSLNESVCGKRNFL